jgi:hypothetical protein
VPAGYTIETTADVALTAATAKTILSFLAAANALIRLVEFGVSFDGTSATAEPATIELCGSTEGAAGTSTAQTPVQMRGPTRTVQGSGKRNFTAEPTTLTCWKRWLVHPQTGIEMQYPLGREPEQITTADAMCLRVTAPATLNAQGYMEVEEG